MTDSQSYPSPGLPRWLPVTLGSRPSAARRRLLLLIAVFLLAALQPLVALAEETKDPLYIEADAVELDENEATSLYVGNVEVEQGGMRLFADRVLVHHEADNKPRLMIATGVPARFEQDPEGDEAMVEGLALRMEYLVARDEITFIDDALVIQGEDRVASDRILYDRGERRVKAGASAEGSERVRIRLKPRE